MSDVAISRRYLAAFDLGHFPFEVRRFVDGVTPNAGERLPQLVGSDEIAEKQHGKPVHTYTLFESVDWALRELALAGDVDAAPLVELHRVVDGLRTTAMRRISSSCDESDDVRAWYKQGTDTKLDTFDRIASAMFPRSPSLKAWMRLGDAFGQYEYAVISQKADLIPHLEQIVEQTQFTNKHCPSDLLVKIARIVQAIVRSKKSGRQTVNDVQLDDMMNAPPEGETVYPAFVLQLLRTELQITLHSLADFQPHLRIDVGREIVVLYGQELKLEHPHFELLYALADMPNEFVRYDTIIKRSGLRLGSVERLHEYITRLRNHMRPAVEAYAREANPRLSDLLVKRAMILNNPTSSKQGRQGEYCLALDPMRVHIFQ